jgi:glyoxylase-like metal-dependent hydrolase (beta-lactamase superfamily II)
MEIIMLPVGMLGANCYILFDPEAPECVVIDPGDEPRIIISRLNSLRIEPKYIAITHAHPDHIGAIPALKEAWPEAKIMIHEAEFGRLREAENRISVLMEDSGSDQIIVLKEGDEIRCGSISLEVMHTPGHSPGGVCYLAKEDNCVFTGDTLFYGSVGRADFPGGDIRLLRSSIQEKLYKLPEDMVVYPGHSQETTIGEEMRNNIFIRADS